MFIEFDDFLINTKFIQEIFKNSAYDYEEKKIVHYRIMVKMAEDKDYQEWFFESMSEVILILMSYALCLASFFSCLTS